MRDGTSLNTLCIENHRAFSSVFIERTQKLNLNSSKAIIHLKFNSYMILSTDTTKGNITLTLLKIYVYRFCKLYYCCWLETRIQTHQTK